METVIDNFSGALQNNKRNFHTINKSIVNNWNILFNTKIISSMLSFDTEISIFNNTIQQRIGSLNNISFEDMNNWHKAVLRDKEKHFKDGHNFNIFHLLKEKFGFSIQETMHSRLIKFLIDATETHGQGNLFLLEFLKMLDIESPEIGNWHVTAEIGRIDVLIEREYPPSIIVIENKSNWATDQQNQLYRYWYRAIFLKTKQHSKKFYENNSRKYQILYLVPNTNKELELQSITKPREDSELIYNGLPEKVPLHITIVTFNEHIQNWLNNCLTLLPENNHRIREYIIQYQSLCINL